MSANLDTEPRRNFLAALKSGSAFYRCASIDLPMASWATIVGVLTICAMHFRTIEFMVHTWAHSDTYQHGFIIPLIVVFLIWRKRGELTGLRPAPSIWGGASLVFCSLLWCLGYLARAYVIQQYAVVGMILSMVWAVLGSEVLRKLRFPLAYLFFAVPAGDVFIPYLRNFTTHFSVLALHWSGVPVYSDGNMLSIPAGDFLVARACSGIRYLIASLALGTLYAYLTYVSYWKRAVFIVLSAIVPILANGLRAYGILMIAQFIGVKYAHGIDHIIYGWVFFGLVMSLMFWFGGFFRNEQHSISLWQPRREQFSRKALSRGASSHWVAALLLICIGISALLPTATYSLERRSRLAEAEINPTLARGAGGWVGPMPGTNALNPVFRHADRRMTGKYVRDGKEVTIHVAYYLRRLVPGEAIAWGGFIADGKHWHLSKSEIRSVALPGGSTMDVVESQIFSRRFGRQLVWYWYDVDGHPTSSRIIQKLLTALTVIRGKGAGIDIVTVSTPYLHKPAAARRLLTNYLDANFSSMTRCISASGQDARKCGS